MQITQIVNSVFNSNTYLLSDNQGIDCWLIDVGDIDAIQNYLKVKSKIKSVFITHTHYDHIYGIKKLIDKYPDCTVYTSKNGLEGFLSDQYNFSQYHEDSIIFDSPNISIVKEGDIISLNDISFMQVYETPGHDWSCLTYKMGEEIVFTGDSFIPGLKVITTFPKSNKNDAEASLEKIKALIRIGNFIHPGHGKIVEYTGK